MAKLFSFILIGLLCFTVSCGTCEVKERVVVKTKILAPTISCAHPDPYEIFRKEALISTEGVTSEGVLFEIISTNVKKMERQILLWENYRECVNKIINEYKSAKEEIYAEEKTEKN